MLSNHHWIFLDDNLTVFLPLRYLLMQLIFDTINITYFYDKINSHLDRFNNGVYYWNSDNLVLRWCVIRVLHVTLRYVA